MPFLDRNVDRSARVARSKLATLVALRIAGPEAAPLFQDMLDNAQRSAEEAAEAAGDDTLQAPGKLVAPPESKSLPSVARIRLGCAIGCHSLAVEHPLLVLLAAACVCYWIARFIQLLVAAL